MRSNNSSTRVLIIGLLAIVWILVVFLGYVSTHKPFTPEQLISVLLSFWRIVVVLFLTSLAGGIGSFPRIEKLSLPPLTIAVLSTAIGYGLISIYVLLWGIIFNTNHTIYIIPLTVYLLLRKRVLIWLKLWRLTSLWQGSSWYGKFVLVSAIIIVISQLVTALAPPLQFDSLTYHFSLPQSYIEQNQIHYVGNLMFWGMPQLSEMLYLFCMIIGGVQSAAVLSWMVGVLALIGIWDFSRAHLGKNPAYITTAALLAGTTLASSLGSGYIEWMAILYGFGMLAFLTIWMDKKGSCELAMAGLSAGLALSTKYTAGIAIIAGLVVIVFSSKRWDIIKSVSVFCLSMLVVFFPWTVKNAVATGNPFYPFFFPTSDFDGIRLAFYSYSQIGKDWSRLVTLPWLATVIGREKGEGYSASIGAIFLSFSPFAWLYWNKLEASTKRFIKIPSIIVLTGFLIWSVASQFAGLLIQTRLYMVIFAAWAFLCAAGFKSLESLHSTTIRFSNVAAAFITLAISFSAFETIATTIRMDSLGTLLGVRTEKSYLEKNMGSYIDAMDTIRALSMESKTLMLWETRGYYCEPRCDSDEIIDRWFHDWRTIGNIDKLITQWQDQGYSHLLLRVDGMNFIRTAKKERYTPSDWQALDELLLRLTPIEKIGKSYILYSLSE